MKKNIRRMIYLLSTALLASILLASSCIAAEDKKFVSVMKDGVNIRSGPSTKSAILWEVFRGFPLQVLDNKNDWAHIIDFEGDKGWIYSSLFHDKKTMIIKVDNANMRSGPGKNYDIIATVKKGVVFTPVESQGNWIKVSYKNDITGWIYNSLLWPGEL